MKLHPAAQILIWCVWAASLQIMVPDRLVAISGLILLSALLMSRHKFILLLRRTRWITLSLLLIYSYSTPGQALFDPLGMYSPTREGLTDGVLQLARIFAALAALAILLERLHRQHLIAGLYTLFAPLQWMGMSRERISVRLALTLHYAETGVLRGASDWRKMLHGLFEKHDEPAKQIELSLHRFGIGDATVLFAAIAASWGILR